jgi:cell division protein FtsQ
MFQFYKWIKGCGLLVGYITLLVGIIWTEKKQPNRICQGIHIHIIGSESHQLVQKSLLLARLTETHEGAIVGKQFHQIASKKIENSINSDNFVRTCKVYKTWNGCLEITVVPKKPIARIIGLNKPDQYIDEQGELLPLSAHYTARVLLLHDQSLLHINKHLKESKYGLALLQLLHLIDQDPFWKAQISQISTDAKKRLNFATQLGKHVVTFGRLESIEEKIKKLKLFYKVILPYKGWGTYKRVNLEFDHQIVCE